MKLMLESDALNRVSDDCDLVLESCKSKSL